MKCKQKSRCGTLVICGRWAKTHLNSTATVHYHYFPQCFYQPSYYQLFLKAVAFVCACVCVCQLWQVTNISYVCRYAAMSKLVLGWHVATFWVLWIICINQVKWFPKFSERSTCLWVDESMMVIVGASKGQASWSTVIGPLPLFMMMQLLQFGPHLLVSMVEKDHNKCGECYV